MTMNREDLLDLEELTKKFPAAAEYLIEIFVTNRDYGIVKNSVIAARLSVSKPAVTQAMNRLKKYDLIEQDLYGAIRLTETGRVTAARLLKRHYLIEHLLIRTLDYHWVKSDEEASRIQAAISDDFAYFLHDKMGRPDTCPHGNPRFPRILNMRTRFWRHRDSALPEKGRILCLSGLPRKARLPRGCCSSVMKIL